MIFDIIFIIILAWAAYRGYKKGFIVQVASLVALLLGIIGTMRFSYITAEFLKENLNFESNYIHIISFIITFIGIVILVHICARIIDKLFKAIALGLVNRFAGVLFSILKFALILSIILSVVNSINSQYSFLPDEEVKQSKLYKPILFLAPALFPKIKHNLQNGIKNYNQNEIIT